jgi:hypothetical protein
MEDVSFPEGHSEEDKAKAYEAYLENHRRTALERFFLGHKDETWFLERYQNGEEFEAESGRIRGKYAAFMSTMAEGGYDSIQLEDGEDLNISGEQEGATSASEKFKNIPLSIKLPARLTNSTIERFEDVLALSNIPPSVKKASIESLLRDSCEQFEAVYLSEPVYEKSLYRSGFAVFREGADLTSLALKIENILIEGNKIYYSVQKSFTRQIKILPPEFSASGRIAKDLGLSSRLLEALCHRYDLEVPNWTADESRSETQRLDLNLSALRKSFNICYYCGQAYSSSLEMFKACGDLHLRPSPVENEEPFEWERATEWLDSKIDDLIRLFGAPFSPATEDNIIESKYVIRLDDSRFRCSLCSKLFKGPEFVIKHARLKHEEESRLALEQLSLLNMFLARPSLCAFLKSPSYRRGSVQGGGHQSYSRDRGYAHRAPPPPPPNADTRALRRPVKHYMDWDAPALGDVEISYD